MLRRQDREDRDTVEQVSEPGLADRQLFSPQIDRPVIEGVDMRDGNDKGAVDPAKMFAGEQGFALLEPVRYRIHAVGGIYPGIIEIGFNIQDAGKFDLQEAACVSNKNEGHIKMD